MLFLWSAEVELLVCRVLNKQLQKANLIATYLSRALVRQANLGASCRVKVPVGQGFSHPPVSSVAFVAEHRDRISHSSQEC
jgi:hypothetical protein